MLAVFTWPASTFAFQAVNVSDCVFWLDPGGNNTSTVTNNPKSHTRFSQRGAGFGGGGLGGSFGGPDLAGLDIASFFPAPGIFALPDSSAVTPFVAAGAGFLLAVLWFDLMHDVQVLGTDAGELPDAVLTSIGGYYRRVTTDARPMNRLVAAVMVATLGAVVAQLAAGDVPSWVAWSSLALTGSPILLAALLTVPSAVRLGRGGDDAAARSRLARSICRQHLACFGAIALLLAIELAFAR